MACSISFPMAMLRLMFSISTVASSTRIPTARAKPPKVIMLIVSPRALKRTMEQRMARGMETAMMIVVRQLFNIQRRRHGRLDKRQQRLDSRNDAQCRRSAALLHRQERGTLPVHAHDVGLRRKAVAHPSNIADINRRGADGFDGNAVELCDRFGSRVGNVNVVLLHADFGSARWQNKILSSDGIDYVQGGKAFRL